MTILVVFAIRFVVATLVADSIGQSEAIVSGYEIDAGSRLASGADDRTVRIWDMRDGREMAVLRHDDPIDAAAFGPDGTRLVSVAGGVVRVWDVGAGRTPSVRVERAGTPGGGETGAPVSPEGFVLERLDDTYTRDEDGRRRAGGVRVVGFDQPQGRRRTRTATATKKRSPWNN